MNYLLIVLVSLLSCGGQLCQKHAASPTVSVTRRRHAIVWLACSLLLLGVAMLLWLWLLQRVEVSIAYPMLSLNMILVTLAARYWWHEPVSGRHVLGIGLVMIGIGLLGGRL